MPKIKIYKNILMVIVLISAVDSLLLSQSQSGDLNNDYFAQKTILSSMIRVADYQIENPSRHSSKNRDFLNGWVPSSFYTGIMALYRASGDDKYLNNAIAWGKENNWSPGPRLRHADDLCCGQTYLELYQIKKDDEMLNPIKERIDSLINSPRSGRTDWWWCDALYMAPPVLARLGKITGQKKYYNYLHEMFWDTALFLFDREEGLFYRDENYFYRRSANGKKVFWSRGNGWVMGGIVRVLQYLPAKDKKRDRYIQLFKTMAASIIKLQGDDGLWRSDLLDPAEFPAPESSGSGFYCYALAWGVNQGILDKAIFLPAIMKAWNGLENCVHPNGKIGWVQPIGKSPAAVTKDATQAYGAGAFLLAGSEMIKLIDENKPMVR